MQRIVGVVALAAALVVGLPGVATASNDPFFPEQWALEAIGAEAAWSQGRGAGAVIAVVDTGVDLDHEDLASKVVGGYDFIDDDADPDDDGSQGCDPPGPQESKTCDEGRGHGTHVAGTAAASTGNGLGVAGVAPDARIMPVRVLDPAGSGSVVEVAKGIRFAADNGADVINLSFGEMSTDDLSVAFTDAIRYAWSKGSIPVVAAGNSAARSSNFTDEPVLVVTATGRGDTRPRYASGVGDAQWGIAAPGGDGSAGSDTGCDFGSSIVSTYAAGTYACLVGTSMAVPHVVGALAVLRGTGLSPQQAVDQLLATADDVGAPGSDTTFGAGRLNLARAVNSPPPAPTTTAAPTTTTEAPALVAAAPATTVPPTTTPAPPSTTTTLPPTTTTPSTISLPPLDADPVAPPPEGQAVAVLPGGGDDATRYVLAVPAGLLIAGMGAAAARTRRRLAAP
ncbi:MAG: S8 family serine peptidase [Actinomycetota bacterium]|nr:S8 family serine peptidase [Actinomycetota bacterium]